jgi:hypothetical protein
VTSRRAYASRDELEPARPHRVDDLPLWVAPTQGEIERDRVIANFMVTKPAVVEALRAEAWKLWEARHEPLSANDVRPVLARLGYEGDHRILVAAFPKADWIAVGRTQHNAPGNHARQIMTFVPKGCDR